MSDHLLGADLFENCPCGHSVLTHDFDEYPTDGTLLCCVDGCDQVLCPGRAARDGGGQ